MKSYILLDRSSSMTRNWHETISALNAYVEGLDADDKIFLAAFDTDHNGLDFQIMRDSKVSKFVPINSSELLPRGMTPLIDAANTILDKAFEDDKKKAVLVFLTDGEENASREATMETVRAKLMKAEERNWEVLFIGANFDGVGKQAASFGVDSSKFLNITTGNAVNEMSALASRTILYKSGTRVEFTEEDRKRASS